VFRVSGTIVSSRPIRMEGESDSFVTVAGQTVPGDGIQLADFGIQIRGGAHDIVLRHLRIRPSAGAGDFQQDIDAIELWGSDGSHVHDVVIDHCSLEWAMDENLSAWGHVTDVTVQRSLVAEARVEGQDHQHAKGVLIGAESADAKPDRFSFHHDVFAHNPDRNPRVAYALTDFRNNLVYDWGGNNSTLFGPYAGFPAGAKPTAVNLVGNVWRKGASTRPTYDDAVWLNPNTRLFPRDNWGTRCPTGCADEWDLGFREEVGGFGFASAATYRAPLPFAVPFVTTYATADLAAIVLDDVGASAPVRDAADARIVADVVAGTGANADHADHPTLASAPPPLDADADGMADDWEVARGLSPADPNDRNDDGDGDGYTALEEYVNGLVGSGEYGCGDGLALPGEACDDGNRVDGDGCDSNCTPTSCGNGIVTTGEDCDDGNASVGDCCSPTCAFETNGSACNDGDLCTMADACDGAGTCLGASAPQPDCRTAAKGSLLVDAKRGQIAWKWLGGAATTIADLGDPVHGDTSYALCVYDAAGGAPGLALRSAIPADVGWKAAGKGYSYRSKTGAPSGTTSLTVRSGAAGKARIGLKGKSAALAVPSLPLAQDPAVTVQLKTSAGVCWSQTYAAPARRNDAAQLKDSFP
jgi:cysteine-rich repeat protein